MGVSRAPELINHVFASRMLLSPLPEVTTAAGPTTLRSVIEIPAEEVGKPGSDHAAVVASFQLAS